jgi:hypothetical protein
MRSPDWKALGAASTAACVALALTACATVQSSGATRSQTSSAARGSASAATDDATDATGETLRQRAEADAAAILRSFAVPPGGRRLGGPPNLPGGALKSPISYLGATWEVHVTGFWEAPGNPQSLLAWEQAHLTARFTLGDADFGPPAWDREFDLAPEGALVTRQLSVEAASAADGQADIRVDAWVAWQPPRPAGSLIPPAARTVTIAESSNGGTIGLAGPGGAQLAPSPGERAVADADAILASVAVPTGARKLSAAPAVEQGALKTPDEAPETPDLVDKAEWWVAPGAPPSVLAWEAKHLSRRFSSSGTSTGSGPGFRMWSRSFTLPAILAVLDSRELVVTVVQDGDKTAILVDAEVAWQPARPASETVPAAAQAVTISMDLGLNTGGRKPPNPVTITDPAKVRNLKALINGLTLFPRACSAARPTSVTIWCSRSASARAPQPWPSPPLTSPAAMSWISPSTESRSRPWPARARTTALGS